MKRKELTKFLAVMTVSAMIAGNGTPIMAADFSADDLTVEAYAAEDGADELEVSDGDSQAAEVTEEDQDIQADDFSDGEVSSAQADTDTAVSAISLKGQIVNPDQDYTGTEKDAEVTDTTSRYNNKDWKKINLVFESSDAKETGMNYLKLFPTISDDDIFEIGTGYSSSKGITGGVTKSVDGSYQVNLGNGNGPAMVSRTYYSILTHADGSEEYYQISVVRYGYAGFRFYRQYDETYPLNPFNFGDAETGEFKSVNANLSAMKYWMMGSAYDEKGQRTQNYEVKVNPEYKGDNFWADEDGYVHAKRAGATSDFLILECAGKTYPVSIIAKYNMTPGKDIFDAKKTDGITDVTSFTDADSFAAIFTEKDRENAKAFFAAAEGLNKDITAGSWNDTTPTAFWSEEWDSARLNTVQDLAPELWKNVYGIQDAKEEITAFADIEQQPEENKEALQAVVDKYVESMDNAYKNGELTSLDKTAEYVAGAKTELKALKTVELEQCNVSLDSVEYIYDGTAKTPQVTVIDSDGEVIAAENYEIAYGENIEAGTASVTVTGKGRYKGSRTVNYTIKKAGQKVTAQKTKYSVMEGTKAFNLGAKAAEGSALTYQSANPKIASVDAKGNVTPVKAGKTTITVTASGNKNYEDTALEIPVEVTKVPVLVKVTTKSFQKTEGDKAFSLGLKTTANPTLTYSSNASSVATVSKTGVVTVKGPGYAVITVTAKIKDAAAQKYTVAVTVKPSAKLAPTVSAKSGKILKVNWKKNSKATGYQIAICKDKTFKSGMKIVTFHNNKTVSASVKAAYSGKKYYVKVRSFKKIPGKTIYGNWSNTISTITKK